MNVVFLSLFLIFELIQQILLVNFVLFFKHFQNLENHILNILKNFISLALWAFFSLKPNKAFRIAQCKQPRLVKPWLNFDINFIFKSTGTALVQVKRALKANFCHQKNNKKAEQTDVAWKFLQPPIQAHHASIFGCPLYFQEYLNPEVRINK